MATVKGTTAADELKGTTAADTISGLAGDDKLEGLAGADILIGSLGAYELIGSATKHGAYLPRRLQAVGSLPAPSRVRLKPPHAIVSRTKRAAT